MGTQIDKFGTLSDGREVDKIKRGEKIPYNAKT